MKKIRQFLILANTSIEKLNRWLKDTDLEIISIQPYSSPEFSTTGSHWLIEYYLKLKSKK